jgi:hypothetical protein
MYEILVPTKGEARCGRGFGVFHLWKVLVLLRVRPAFISANRFQDLELLLYAFSAVDEPEAGGNSVEPWRYRRRKT